MTMEEGWRDGGMEVEGGQRTTDTSVACYLYAINTITTNIINTA
jgi:hypothetical protein